MTEDGTDSSLSGGLIDSPVTPPMFKSAAGWRTESKHLPEAFGPEPFLLPATSCLSPSHATAPGRIRSGFPDHIEAVLQLPSPSS